MKNKAVTARVMIIIFIISYIYCYIITIYVESSLKWKINKCSYIIDFSQVAMLPKVVLLFLVQHTTTVFTLPFPYH